MSQVDVCITATLRPAILQRTLESFHKKLFGKTMKTYRCLLNIDPIGEDVSPDEVIKVAEQFFPSTVPLLSPKASFPNAVHRLWSSASSPFVFYLEDDWELILPVPLSRFFGLMAENPKLAHLRLNFFRTTDRSKNWSYFMEWDDRGFFLCPQRVVGSIGWSGHPSFNRTQFLKACLKYLDPNRNPEKQLKNKNKKLLDIMKQWEFGVFAPQHSRPAIRDIGRAWMPKAGFKKKGSRAFFQTWERTR